MALQVATACEPFDATAFHRVIARTMARCETHHSNVIFDILGARGLFKSVIGHLLLQQTHSDESSDKSLNT